MRAIDLHWEIMAVIDVFIMIIMLIRYRKQKDRKIFYFGLAIIYTILLFKVTVCPIVFADEEFVRAVGLENISYYQFVPFQSIISSIIYGTWPVQVIGNLLLLAPIPVIMYLLEAKTDKKIIPFCIVLSICIEAVQGIIDMIGKYPSHIVDVDDVILNSAGALIAFLIIRRYEKTKNKMTE